MRWKTRIVAAVLMGLAGPTTAHACYLAKHLTLNPVGRGMSYGGGLTVAPGGDDLGLVINGEVNFGIGDGKGVVSPAIGLCKEGDFNEMIFGASAAWQIWKDASGNNSANIQTGLSYVSYDGGNDMVIPLGASYSMKKSDKMTLFGGGNLLFNSFSFDDGLGGEVSDSDMDPALYAGAMLNQGAMLWQFSGGLKFGYETDFALTVVLTLNSINSGSIQRGVSSIWK